MSRKDFELIARVLRESRVSSRLDEATINRISEELADKLRATNPRFNRDKFLRACGM